MTPAEDWKRLRHHVQAALEHGGNDFTLREVEQHIRDGKWEFWPGVDSAVVTAVDLDLRILLAGGTLDELSRMLPEIEADGRRRGCRTIRALGRKGWQRTFLTRDMGLQPSAILYTKILNSE